MLLKPQLFLLFSLREKAFFLFANLFSLFLNQGLYGGAKDDTLGINLRVDSFTFHLKVAQLTGTDRLRNYFRKSERRFLALCS